MKQTLFLLMTVFLTATNLSAQNKDLDAQYLYTQAENAYAKNEFEDCINFCEKAASTLGETNPKILLLQFNAYDAILQKCPYNNLLKDTKKINNYLDFFFSHIDINTYSKDKYFEAKKFKDDFQNSYKIMAEIESNTKWYTFEDLGLIVVKEKYNGAWIKVNVANGPIKEQTSMKDGLWINGCCEDIGNNAIKYLNGQLKWKQGDALRGCQEFFVFKLDGEYGIASGNHGYYEIKLPTRPLK